MTHIRGQPRDIKRRNKTNFPLHLKIPFWYISGFVNIYLLRQIETKFIKQLVSRATMALDSIRFPGSKYYNIITACEVKHQL